MRSDRESTSNDRDGLLTEFVTAVSSLAEGELTFPAPFDLSSAAALADNIDQDDIAVRLFDVTAQRECAYTVRIYSHSPGHPEMGEREVIDTAVTSAALLEVLLEGLLDEIRARQDNE